MATIKQFEDIQSWQKAREVGYAKGSCGELRSQLYRVFDRNYITQIEFDQLKISVMNISGLIQNLIRYLQKSEVAGVRKKSAPKEL